MHRQSCLFRLVSYCSSYPSFFSAESGMFMIHGETESVPQVRIMERVGEEPSGWSFPKMAYFCDRKSSNNQRFHCTSSELMLTLQIANNRA
jgi:hypothetical protein